MLGRRALVELEQRAEIEQAGRLVQLVALEAQLAQQQIADPRVEVGRHLEAHGVARAAAPVEARLHRLHEIAARAALLVEVEIGVARHAEEARARDLVLGEQQAEVRADHLLDGRVAARSHLPPARQERRHLHAREPARTAAARLHERAHREREPGDEGERVRRVDAERDQHRRDLLVERRERSRALLVGELVPVREVDSRAAQRGPQLALERLVRGPRQLEHALADRRELRAGREPVGSGGLVALRHEVLELRHPHLEELVEVAREDREELRALEDRPARVARELEHAAVELEPGELAVEEALGGVAHPTRVDRRPASAGRADQPTAVVGSIMLAHLGQGFSSHETSRRPVRSRDATRFLQEARLPGSQLLELLPSQPLERIGCRSRRAARHTLGEGRTRMQTSRAREMLFGARCLLPRLRSVLRRRSAVTIDWVSDRRTGQCRR